MEEPIGERLRDLRTEKGWTQNVLGYHAGRSPSVISQVETGKREPELSTVKALAGALGIDWRYLLLGDETPKAEAPSGSGQSGRENPAEERLGELLGSLISRYDSGVVRWKKKADQNVFDNAELAEARITVNEDISTLFQTLYSVEQAAREGTSGLSRKLTEQYVDAFNRLHLLSYTIEGAVAERGLDREVPEDIRWRGSAG